MAYLRRSVGTVTSKIRTSAFDDDAVTLAKMAGGTDGNIISYDASGDPVAIATGSDGEVLTSTGAGSPPAMEAIAGGKTLGVTEYTSATRTSVGSQTTYYMFDTTYTQVKASSQIQVQAFGTGYQNSAGAEDMNIYYDTTTYTGVGGWGYNTQNARFCFRYLVYFAGAGSTGSKTFRIGWNAAAGGNHRPFQIWNPDSNDNSRMTSTRTTVLVTEYDF